MLCIMAPAIERDARQYRIPDEEIIPPLLRPHRILVSQDVSYDVVVGIHCRYTAGYGTCVSNNPYEQDQTGYNEERLLHNPTTIICYERIVARHLPIFCWCTDPIPQHHIVIAYVGYIIQHAIIITPSRKEVQTGPHPPSPTARIPHYAPQRAARSSSAP